MPRPLPHSHGVIHDFSAHDSERVTFISCIQTDMTQRMKKLLLLGFFGFLTLNQRLLATEIEFTQVKSLAVAVSSDRDVEADFIKQSLLITAKGEVSFSGSASSSAGARDANSDLSIHLEAASATQDRLIVTHPTAHELGGEIKSVYLIDRTDSQKHDIALQKLTAQAANTAVNQDAFRQLTVALGSGNSKQVAIDNDGALINRATLEKLSTEQAEALFYAESERNRSWGKALIEVGSFLGIGGIWYYANLELNKLDWEYEMNLPGLKKKLREGFRFDNNMLALNSPGHPLAGAIYYGFGRGNGLTTYESLILAFSASFFWEFVCEYREVVSFNDMTFTPFGGAAIGEVFHQFATFFEQSRSSWYNSMLAGLFGGTTRLSDWIAKNRVNPVGVYDKHGFNAKTWHSFQLFVASGNQGNQVGIDMQLKPIPGFEQEGTAAKFSWEPGSVELLFKAGFDSNGLYDFQMFLRTVFFGYYKKDLRVEQGRLNGYSFYVGGASSFEHNSHTFHGENSSVQKDEMGIVNILGPSIEFAWFYKGMVIRAQVEITPTFAAIHSLAYEKYDSTHTHLATKSVLETEKYYFAFGFNASGKLAVELGPVTLKGQFAHLQGDSIEGSDRLQKKIEDDYSLSDSYDRLQLSATVNTPLDWLKVSVYFEQLRRQGQIRDTVVQELENGLYGRLNFVF